MRRLSRRRAARHESGTYLIDGPTLLAEALAAEVELETVYIESDALDPMILESIPDQRLVREVRPGTLAKVLDVVTPNRVVAVARMASSTVDQVVGVAASEGLPLLVLVDVSDPGNVGTLIRAAEAAGCRGVILSAGSADPYSPKAVRASAGSLFRVPVVISEDMTSTLTMIEERGMMTLAAAGDDGRAPESLDLGSSFALLMGNEAHGLPAEVVDRSTATVSIPMAGAVESLNVAMAATVVLFEAARQRRMGSTSPTV